MNTWIFLPAYFELLPLFDIIRMFMSVCVDLATLFDTLGQASHRENIRKDQHNLPLCRERPVTGDYPDKGSVMWKTLHHNAQYIMLATKKIPMFDITGSLCGERPVADGSPLKASQAENPLIPWRHHDTSTISPPTPPVRCPVYPAYNKPVLISFAPCRHPPSQSDLVIPGERLDVVK